MVGVWKAGALRGLLYAAALHHQPFRGLGERTKLASSWMVTAVVGGAIMPILMGWLADHHSMRAGFLMPLVCFAFIAFYGFNWQRLFAHDIEPAAFSPDKS